MASARSAGSEIDRFCRWAAQRQILQKTWPYLPDVGGSDGHGRTTAVDVGRMDGRWRTRRTCRRSLKPSCTKVRVGSNPTPGTRTTRSEGSVTECRRSVPTSSRTIPAQTSCTDFCAQSFHAQTFLVERKSDEAGDVASRTAPIFDSPSPGRFATSQSPVGSGHRRFSSRPSTASSSTFRGRAWLPPLLATGGLGDPLWSSLFGDRSVVEQRGAEGDDQNGVAVDSDREG